MRQYQHNVIRFRKNEFSNYMIFEIIVILNKKKSSSRKIVEKLGFLHILYNKIFFTLNFLRLGYFLNRGVIINPKIKNLIGYFCLKNTKIKFKNYVKCNGKRRNRFNFKFV